MTQDESLPVVVARLEDDGGKIAYSCLSQSPDGRLVIVGGEVTAKIVSVKPSGLKEVRSIRLSKYLQATKSAGNIDDGIIEGQKSNRYANVQDIFSNPASTTMTKSVNITISDISWSYCQSQEGSITEFLPPNEAESDVSNPFQAVFAVPGDLTMADDSLVAVAGSNGVVIIWRACDLLRQSDSQNKNQQDVLKQYYSSHQNGRLFSTDAIGYPEAVMVEHSKPTKLSWNSKDTNLLLTASHDGTARLWERKERIISDKDTQEKKKNWKDWIGEVSATLAASDFNGSSANQTSYTWQCRCTFKPNCGPIRDVKWNRFHPDLFAMVTNDGFLVVYNYIVPHRPMVRIAAHAREATSLDWHPTKPYVIATGGIDKTLKIWDLQSELSPDNLTEKGMDNIRSNCMSTRSTLSNDSDASSSDTVPSVPRKILDHSYHGAVPSLLPESVSSSNTLNSFSNFQSASSLRSLDSRRIQGFASRGQKSAPRHLYEICIPAKVETLLWRPPKRALSDDDDVDSVSDKHDGMLAVCTSPLSGTTSDGSGSVYLVSYDRPFMPLSIVDGHIDKGVSDFIWLDTPKLEHEHNKLRKSSAGHNSIKYSDDMLSGTWQHILTIGKDGNCLVQSFCRGHKPMNFVSPSAFAVANLSPIQKGYGSIQIIAAHQNVPAGSNNYASVCSLRRDKFTDQAAGFFREPLNSINMEPDGSFLWSPDRGDLREESVNVDLTFSTLDAGDFEDLRQLNQSDEIAIAPEVVHLSRFASGYKLRRDSKCPTKALVCRHNANVATELRCEALARMWHVLASMIEGCGSDDLSNADPQKNLTLNALSFSLLPTLKALLIERADAGDVQTCVVMCEVMEIIPKKQPVGSVAKLAILDLDYLLVRQWYLSYIELLQQMRLFSHATNLISKCRDPEIAKLNQQSTTFHEACASCFKPLDGQSSHCKSCRQRTGLCCLCYSPVRTHFAFCIGCGHGGHLKCLSTWFFSEVGNKLREQCPTGCGHRCNLITSKAGALFSPIRPPHTVFTFQS